MSIGNGTNNVDYTPPDYRGAFLRGTGTNGTDKTYSGPTVNNSQKHATQTHNHTVNDPGHTHTLSTYNDNYDFIGGTDQPPSFNRNDGGTGKVWNIISASATGVTINDSTTNVDPNETRPYNYGVNWIIKL